MNYKRITGLVTGMAIVSVLLIGCQQDNTSTPNNNDVEVTENENQSEVNNSNANNENVADVDVIQLSDWEGTWRNMGAYLDDPELEPAFAELAEREGVSVDEAKENFAADGAINFDGLVIEGNQATFLDGFKDDGGEVIKEVTFEYTDSRTVKHGNFDTEWFVFESDDDEYTYLLLMPVHGEESLTHFHLRYGDNIEDILAQDDWYPVLVRPQATYDQLYEEITE